MISARVIAAIREFLSRNENSAKTHYPQFPRTLEGNVKEAVITGSNGAFGGILFSSSIFDERLRVTHK